MQRPLPQSPPRTTRLHRFQLLAARFFADTLRSPIWLALAVALVAACNRSRPIPAPDPDGKDLVRGAIVAATEASGGVRLYKITQVDSIPDPAGDEYHMVVFDPKANTFEDSAALYRDKKLTVVLPHILVRKVLFMTRDHRVVGVETVTDAEKLSIVKSQR
jgi:hypothetical protein